MTLSLYMEKILIHHSHMALIIIIIGLQKISTLFINLSCILLSPIISQWNIMKLVIKTKVTHDLIRGSKQVFHKTIKAPAPVTKITGSTTIIQEHLFSYVQLKQRNKCQQISALIFLTNDNSKALLRENTTKTVFFFSKKGYYYRNTFLLQFMKERLILIEIFQERRQ